jgi:hypothetical protein
MDQIPVSFQPEIGSVSSPVVESLRRFMSAEVLAEFPSSLSSPVVNETTHPIWWWHNYEYRREIAIETFLVVVFDKT